MNILTIDLEEWYIYQRPHFGDRGRWEPILNNLLNEVLDLFDERQIKVTFFVLGIMARQNPKVISQIASKGHEIASHGDKHQWLSELNRNQFGEDIRVSIDSLEQIIGKKVRGYRAPAFSVGKNNLWVFETLIEHGIEYDCSVFPASRAFGGFPGFTHQTPSLICYNGCSIKEFPIPTANVFGSQIAFSGGGYFRLLPYSIINRLTKENEYVMSYFHLRDFDSKQKRRFSMRYFQTYYGIDRALSKFRCYVADFNFVNVEMAERSIDWTTVPEVNF